MFSGFKGKYIHRLILSIFLSSIILGQAFSGYSNSRNVAFAVEYQESLNEFYISEQNYNEDMKKRVEPFLNNKKKTGFIDGRNNAKLYFEEYKVDNAIANIVILHGYRESLERYHEAIYYFLNSGYNVFGIEHRGHGRSGTLGIEDKTQIHVEKFDYYVDDVKKFMDEIVKKEDKNKKTFLFAHSMGGAIGTKFLEENQGYFDGAVLDSPMLEINTGNIPSFVAKIVVNLAVTFGMDGEYVLGKGPYVSTYDPKKIGTSCITRYDYYNEIVKNNEQLQRGGGSYRWTYESFNATSEIIKKENASKVEIPIILFQAGHDTYVEEDGQNEFAKNALNCEIIRTEDSRHQCYLETDNIQKAYFKKILKFYSDNI